MAEYFRDVEGQDVLLFIDNIFRFIQAGSEVSALLGRMPSAVGYQPTLADEMGQLQERITSTRGTRSPPCRRSTCPPTTSPTRRRHTAFAHLDATTTLSRAISEKGIYPAVDPLDSTSTDPDARGRRRGALPRGPRVQRDPAALQGAAGHHRHPRHRRAVRRGQGHGAAGAGGSSASCPSQFSWPSSSPASRAKYVPIAETIRGFEEIIEGKHDDLPEQAFFMVGGIEDVEKKAREMER